MSLKADDFAKQLEILLDPIYQSRAEKLKLILHAGTPKTGTTSLQVYLTKKQRKLRHKGILYPNCTHNTDAPKHQWFEKNLVRIHPQNFLDNFVQILKEVDENTHTILLSSEGIYNHWWDFTEESNQLLKALNKHFEINVWVWFRDPLDFAESFYKQCLRNPVIQSITCYGKDLSFAETLADPWFKKRLDYMGFINDCEKLFGDSSVTVFKYQEDTVQIVSQLLGLSTPHDNPTPRQNPSMNNLTADLYRVLNRLNLSAKDKEKFVPHVKTLNAEIKPYLSRIDLDLIDEKSKEEIIQMTSQYMITLEKRYFKG